MALPAGEIHLWVSAFEHPIAASRGRLLLGELAPQERDRLGRFHFERDRHQYLLAHALLRRTLGSLPAVPCLTKQSPAAVLTDWLTHDPPADITLGEDYELREGGENGAIVRCRRQDPGADEIQSHLRSGKYAVKLALAWNERLSCVVDAELGIRRLRFGDILEEERAGVEADDEASRLDADFALMTMELSQFLPRLLEVFGGEDEEAYGPSEQAA